MQVGFIGAGRMAQAIARGIISAGKVKASNIIASSPKQDLAYIEEIATLGCQTTFNNCEVVEKSDVVIVAVKPPVIPNVMSEVAPVVSQKQLIISIALGIAIKDLEQMLPRTTRVIRVMPNIPCLVRAGASVFARGTSTREDDGNILKEFFSSVGTCEEIPEVLIDAATGLSGSGPAYMFIAIEALADGGVKMGIPRDLSLRLAAQTLMGAAKMVLDTGRHPGSLKDDVCSPAGCSIQGVYHLERSGLRASLIEAVEVSTVRSIQTGKRQDKSK
uniref:pyrroline-5-carboxylate reductase n=1 Tax=Strigamia maritima TaxID=126957 RepID=T1JNJ4_STRMM